MFRYWRSEDDERLLSVYKFNVKIVLECHQLDNQQMVIPKGDYIFNEIDVMLSLIFRDKVIVAEDDPKLNLFKTMSDSGMIKLMVLPDVGLEKIAEGIYNHVNVILVNQELISRIDIRSVEIEDGDVNISYIA